MSFNFKEWFTVNVPVFNPHPAPYDPYVLGLPDPHPDLLVRGTDPRIRIHTNMSRIPSTVRKNCTIWFVPYDLSCIGPITQLYVRIGWLEVKSHGNPKSFLVDCLISVGRVSTKHWKCFFFNCLFSYTSWSFCYTVLCDMGSNFTYRKSKISHSSSPILLFPMVRHQ